MKSDERLSFLHLANEFAKGKLLMWKSSAQPGALKIHRPESTSSIFIRYWTSHHERKRKPRQLTFNELWVQARQEWFSSGKDVYFIPSYIFFHMIVHMLGILNDCEDYTKFS